MVTEETKLDVLVKKLTNAVEWNNNEIVFLLGAGCSRSSGIPGAKELASRWLRELPSEKAKEFYGKNVTENYFEIFSALFLPDERKSAIEAFTKNAYPGIGYAIFAKLLHSADKWGNKKKERFKTIITTNFDNLIEQAFILFTPERPLVIPDPKLIGFLKDGTKVSVVKIHGDSRYAPLNEKSTVNDIPGPVISALSERIRDGVLIVLGYAGTEPGVAKLISKLVTKKKIKQIWWVDSNEPALPIWKTLDGYRFVEVKKPDFDEFMLKLKQEIESVSHVSATQMDEHLYRYHDQMMWRLGLYGKDGAPSKTKISETHFADYFRLFAKASQTLEISHKDAALHVLQTGLKDYSQSANYNIFLGAFYKTIMGQHEDAINHFKRAKRLAPLHSGVSAELANILKEASSREDKNAIRSIIDEFERAEQLDPLNINNTLNYAGFLLAQDSEEENRNGRIKLNDCEKNLYEPKHRMEFVFYVFAHQIEVPNIIELLKELKQYLSEGLRSPDFDLSWNVQKAENDKHPHIALVRNIETAIKSGPSDDIEDVLTAITRVLEKQKANGSKSAKASFK